jgi:hypothetical protein
MHPLLKVLPASLLTEKKNIKRPVVGMLLSISSRILNEKAQITKTMVSNILIIKIEKRRYMKGI